MKRTAWWLGLGILMMGSMAPLGCDRSSRASGTRVIILGFDGMDHGLTTELMAAGRLPNFSRLAKEGTFAPLGTSIPPQSPVAWSNFITGMDAGGHGIFDFMHRDPVTMLPTFSTSKVVGSDKTVELGKYQVPLSGGTMELLRRGEAFWEVLERQGIDTTIIRMPANFPPSGTATRELSGMGTPDLLGNYGSFSFYTTRLVEIENTDIGGGEVYEVFAEDDIVEANLYGMENPFLVEPTTTKAPFTLYLDPVDPVARLVIGDEERILQEGEWSDWVPVTFSLIPTQSVAGICRFYLKQVRPDFQLYVSPINIDPLNIAMPISHPSSYATDLAEATGRFYTQGMPEDTNALDGGIFSRADFMAQAGLAGDEFIEQYKYVLDEFDEGLLFYYFGNLDQTSHMMWRPMDTDHPAYDAETDALYQNTIAELYEQMDRLVGYTTERMGEDTLLVVMSDHGFASWRRAFHVNAWLRDSGFLEVIDPDLEDDPGLFMNVDWSRTKAYSLGFNSLYVNQKGREAWGIVEAADRRPLLEAIAAKLRETVDPETGQPVVVKAYISEDAYEDRGALDIGPDMVLGWSKGVRCHDASSLGKVSGRVFADNMRVWSGDHLMDPSVVPGILLSSRPLKKPAPRLQDLAAAVLAEFGIVDFPSASESRSNE